MNVGGRQVGVLPKLGAQFELDILGGSCWLGDGLEKIMGLYH